MENDENNSSSSSNNNSNKGNDNDNQISLSNSNNIFYDSKVNINENQNNFEQNQNSKTQTNSYSLLSSNISLDTNDNKIKNKKKKKKTKKKYKKVKKIKEKNYFKNIYKKKSIIGICLNLFFWIWTILLILDNNQIIRFPRSSHDKKVDIIYAGANNDSFWGGILSTIICTIFNYILGFFYPEIIFFISYCVYVVYSVLIIPSEKFNESKCFLSYNMYLFLVFLTFGEIYKLYARKYLDI